VQYSDIRIDQPPPLGFRVWCLLRRTAPGRWAYRRQWQRDGAAFLLSYPKAGRTWVRLMLGKVLAEHYDLEAPFEDVMALDRLHSCRPGVPLILPKHDDYPQLKTPSELVVCKDEYRFSRVILLVRDIRDLAVSAYFQMSKRRGKFGGTLSDFLHNERGGVSTMIRFHNIWAQQRHQARGFLLVRYEDLHRDAERELRRMVDFLDLGQVSDETLSRAVEFASYQNMRKRETGPASAAGPNRLDGGSLSDPESLKTRKGKVGGFADYMGPEDAAWLTTRLEQELDPMYGYPYCSPLPDGGTL